MADVDELVDRWRDAGIIDDDTAERIRAYEETNDTRGGESRPGIFEALIYIGLAVIGVGAFVLVALVWDDMATWARVAITLVPGLGALGLGYLLQTTPEPGMKRGGSLAWVLATGLLTGAVAVMADASALDGEDVAVVSSLFLVALGIVLWVFLPWHPQLVALGSGFGFLALAIQVQSDHGGPAVFAGVLVLLAATWIMLTEITLLKPRNTARVLGGFALAGGSYLLGLDQDVSVFWESAAFIAGVALVALSIVRASFAYMVFGIGVLFLGFVTFTMMRVPDPIVGALVLMLSGVLLVAAVLVLARWKPWQGSGATA